MDGFKKLIPYPNVCPLIFANRYKCGYPIRKLISKCVLLASRKQKIVITFSFCQLLLKPHQVNSLQIFETASRELNIYYVRLLRDSNDNTCKPCVLYFKILQYVVERTIKKREYCGLSDTFLVDIIKVMLLYTLPLVSKNSASFG